MEERVRRRPATEPAASVRRAPPGVNAAGLLRLAVLLLAGVLLGLGACATRAVYGQFDRLAAWYVEGLVDLEPAQRTELRALLGEQLRWHRASQLPRYADSLGELAAAAAEPLGVEGFERVRLEADGHWQTLVRQFAPDVARFVVALDDAQLEGLWRELEARDAKRARETARRSAEARERERVRGFVRALERWTGRLDEPQRARIAAGLARIPSLEQDWLANRERWRTDLRVLLARRSDSPAFRAELEALLLEPQRSWTPEYRAALDANRERYVLLLAEVDAGLTPRQRRHLQDRLGSWSRELRALVRT